MKLLHYLISNFITAESTGNAFSIDSGDHIEHQNYVWWLRKRFSAESGEPDTVENYFVPYNRTASISIAAYEAADNTTPTLQPGDREYQFKGFKVELTYPTPTEDEDDA